jgi:hypothetical protein
MEIDDLIRALKSFPEAQSALDTGASSGRHSELHSVLRQAAGGTHDVPPGWCSLQQDAERMLQSASATVESRRELQVTHLYVLGSQPVVRLSKHDRVVHGIYRRTIVRARHTCQVCARAGRAWDCLSQFRVLCARCAAPHAVAADLDMLQALRDRQRRAGHDAPVAELPVRLASTIADGLSHSRNDGEVQHARPAQLVRPTTHEEFERWCAWLLALRESPKFVEALGLTR